MDATQAIRKILTSSTFDVFEKMFFIFLEPSVAEDPQHNLGASVSFTGPLDGNIRIHLSDALVSAMVENILSIAAQDVTPEMKEDCAKEAVNMIGGQFLRSLDPTNSFHMALPVCLRETVGTGRGSAGQDRELCLNFESERGHINIRVSIPAQRDSCMKQGTGEMKAAGKQ